MTLSLLQSYDAGVVGITVNSATATNYCIQAVVGSKTWRKNGPGAILEALPC